MAKTLWHSDLVSLSPIKVTINSCVKESIKKKGSFYVEATVNGEERYINPEHTGIMDFFDAHKGQTVTICAKGRGDDATITVVGAEVPRQTQRPAAVQQPAPVHASAPAPAQPIVTGTVPHDHVMGMRATEIEYSFTQGLPNYCSEKIGIVVALEPGAKAADALESARKFVHSQIQQVK